MSVLFESIIAKKSLVPRVIASKVISYCLRGQFTSVSVNCLLSEFRLAANNYKFWLISQRDSVGRIITSRGAKATTRLKARLISVGVNSCSKTRSSKLLTILLQLNLQPRSL
jgi:hypothetical protein